MSIVFPFPVLHEESPDYIDPEAYSSRLQRLGLEEVDIEHRLRADTHIASLMRQGKAAFYCTLSVRGTAFRKTRTVEQNAVDSMDGGLAARQRVSIPPFRWRPELFASTGIVLLEDQEVDPGEAKGVSDFHLSGALLRFPAQAKLAFNGWKRFFSMSALFRIRSDKDIEIGAFRTQIVRDSQLHISIEMNPTLFDEIESGKRSPARAHVLCSALSQVFQEILQSHARVQLDGHLNPHEEDDAQLLELAEGLQSYLKSNNVKTWADDDFNPTAAASSLYKAMAADDSNDGEQE